MKLHFPINQLPQYPDEIDITIAFMMILMKKIKILLSMPLELNTD